MNRVLDQLSKGAHVTVVRLRSLGDCVLTTPALRLLKRHRPDLRLGVVVERPFEAIFEGNSDVDDILPPSLSALRHFGPQLCLNLHGGTRSLVLTVGSGARFRAGFGHYRYSWMHNVVIPTAQEVLNLDRKVHTAEHLASAMFYLGVPQQEIPRARLFTKPMNSKRPYVVIHGMASAARKAWPVERFLELAAYFQQHCDLEPVFIGGPGDDLTPFHPFRTQCQALNETKSVLAGASLFMGNDSGPAHMAAAFGIPLVVLFAVSDPVVWAPWKAHAESIVAPDGMASISTEKVIECVTRLRARYPAVTVPEP